MHQINILVHVYSQNINLAVNKYFFHLIIMYWFKEKLYVGDYALFNIVREWILIPLFTTYMITT